MIQAKYIDHMGSDLAVVNAARVSLDKHHEEFEEGNDDRLIDFLARNGHKSPFFHPQITLRCKAPIFVARQAFRHKVGLAENEASRRYIDNEPEFYHPKWRKRAEGVKQGSKDEPPQTARGISKIFEQTVNDCLANYEAFLKEGVAPEQARAILPQAMMTEWYWTGSLAAYARFANLRSHEDAQREIQELANQVENIIEPLFPYSWKALRKYEVR